MSKSVQIAIIGGGASGTATAIQLLKKLTVPATIYLVEKNEQALFRGAAYSGKLDYEPLNVQAGRMSLFNDRPDDFFEWVKANKQAETTEEVTKDSFVSRRWYGDYLEQQFDRAVKAAANVRVEIVPDCCDDMAYLPVEDLYQIRFSKSKPVLARYIVFANGNEQPASIFNETDKALMGDSYVSNPWSIKHSVATNENENILFIGCGLTMIDNVVSLQKQGHKGKIYCLSRNGYLPLPHCGIQAFNFEVDKHPTDVAEAVTLLNRNIGLAKERQISWQNVIDAMRPFTSQFWRSLPVSSKSYFLKRLRPYWEIHRHRMPLASSKAIEQLVKEGQLELWAGFYQSVSITENRKLQFRFSRKTDRKMQTLIVDKIVNCTGPSTDYHTTENTLFKQLLNKGWMKQDVLKLGVETGYRGEIIQQNGVILRNAFAIGPVRRAAEWETTAMREIRTQAENIATILSQPAEKGYEMILNVGL